MNSPSRSIQAGLKPAWCGSTKRSGHEMCGIALSSVSRSISDSRTSRNS